MIQQQPGFVGSPVFIPSEYPVQCVCPNCRNSIVTRTEKDIGLFTWLLVGGLILIGCWLGCCLIPLCVDACKVKYIQKSHPQLFLFFIGYNTLLSKLFYFTWC